MTADLQTLLSQPSASFEWSQAADGSRTIGTCPGCAVDLWPDRVEAAAVFASDQPDLSARNAMLFILILAALRPNWVTAPDWITTQMRMAAKARGPYEGVNYSRQVRFTFDRAQSRATLKVKKL